VSIVNRAGIGTSSQFDSPSPGPLINHAIYVLMDAEYRTAIIDGPRATMAAYACSPAEPLGDQKITGIVITSNNRLSTPGGHYDAGTDLSGLFLVSMMGSIQPITQVLNADLYSNAFYLVSGDAVDVGQKHTFTVTVSLDDGRSFDLVTQEADLTPN
jgi:hypothetical protein